jgi:hypothetical protein
MRTAQPVRPATTCVKVVPKKGAINHPDPEQKASHRLAGTAIDVFGGLRACDPKRLAIYFTKHSSPNTLSSKEYQHPTSRPASVNGSLAGHMGPDPGKHFRAGGHQVWRASCDCCWIASATRLPLSVRPSQNTQVHAVSLSNWPI